MMKEDFRDELTLADHIRIALVSAEVDEWDDVEIVVSQNDTRRIIAALESRWIPVEERLPDEIFPIAARNWFAVQRESKHRWVQAYFDGGKFWEPVERGDVPRAITDATHWREIEPPQDDA